MQTKPSKFKKLTSGLAVALGSLFSHQHCVYNFLWVLLYFEAMSLMPTVVGAVHQSEENKLIGLAAHNRKQRNLPEVNVVVDKLPTTSSPDKLVVIRVG